MIDFELAEIYGYITARFNEQVKNNIEKFDNDFMFQLNKSELEYLQSNFLTANISSKSRSMPYAFRSSVFICSLRCGVVGSRLPNAS